MKELERPVNKAAPNDMGWASDVAAEMLRKLNIKSLAELVKIAIECDPAMSDGRS